MNWPNQGVLAGTSPDMHGGGLIAAERRGAGERGEDAAANASAFAARVGAHRPGTHGGGTGPRKLRS